jgi:cobaltochelatase CobN
VGLDTPVSAVTILRVLARAGYRIIDAPEDGKALIQRLLAGPTNARPGSAAEESLSFADYSVFFATLPLAVQQAVAARWGPGERDPFFRSGRLDCGRFAIPGFRAGNVAVLIEPARGYNIDPKSAYHDPAFVPPHAYFAAYAWLAEDFRADAVIHLGKLGTLEWLPGKALAPSAECFPEAVVALWPHLYPFIVNDPGEGTQAKRRSQAVIADHLTPPLSRAGSYGRLAELERLIDEYYEAAQGDTRRVAVLAAAILDQARDDGLDGDCGITGADDRASALRKLDGFLCELKELHICDGLHVFGISPAGERLDALLLAFARAGRGAAAEDASLVRALAADLGLGRDPLTLDPAEPWSGPRPAVLTGEGPWRSAGDPAERLESLASRLVSGKARAQEGWLRTRPVLEWIEQRSPNRCRLRRSRARGVARQAGGGLYNVGPFRRAEPRPAGGTADRPQFFLGRYPRGADASGLAARLEIGRIAPRTPRPGVRRLSGAGRVVGLGHREYENGRR